MPEIFVLKTAFVGENAKKRIDQCLTQPGRWKITVEEVKKKRSISQNDISHAWYAEIAKYMGDEGALQKKCQSKLHCGVPLLRAESDKFRNDYDNLIKNRFSYEEKVRMMEWFPVTSLMNTKQMTEYLERMQEYWSKEGIRLEFPAEEYEQYKEASQ